MNYHYNHRHCFCSCCPWANISFSGKHYDTPLTRFYDSDYTKQTERIMEIRMDEFRDEGTACA